MLGREVFDPKSQSAYHEPSTGRRIEYGRLEGRFVEDVGLLKQDDPYSERLRDILYTTTAFVEDPANFRNPNNTTSAASDGQPAPFLLEPMTLEWLGKLDKSGGALRLDSHTLTYAQQLRSRIDLITLAATNRTQIALEHIYEGNNPDADLTDDTRDRDMTATQNDIVGRRPLSRRPGLMLLSEVLRANYVLCGNRVKGYIEDYMQLEKPMQENDGGLIHPYHVLVITNRGELKRMYSSDKPRPDEVDKKLASLRFWYVEQVGKLK